MSYREFSFAQLDCKSMDHYSAVDVYDVEPFYNEAVYNVMEDMSDAYLKGVAELQERLTDEFGPRFDEAAALPKAEPGPKQDKYDLRNQWDENRTERLGRNRRRQYDHVYYT